MIIYNWTISCADLVLLTNSDIGTADISACLYMINTAISGFILILSAQ